MLVNAVQVLVIVVVAGLRLLLNAEFLAENVFVCFVFVKFLEELNVFPYFGLCMAHSMRLRCFWQS